ncbi:MAG: DegT/DnrJ/EryC1/StrS family aminotransferase [Armatimonadota bacterium]
MAIDERPAIAGGTPVKKTPFTRAVRYGEEELKELKDALDQQTLFYAQGRKTHQLEETFARKNGMPYAVASSSGTASIHAAMMALGISPGDEVITSPITDMGSIAPILFQGAVPVFADLDPESYCITPETVEAVITPHTRAVLAIHLWGNACGIDGLLEVCKKHNIILIEDCAQAFGCTYNGKPVGTFGGAGCFSFNEFKHISCGDGGIILTHDEKTADRLRLATDKGYNRKAGAAVRNPVFLAANYRITELQSAVALAQLGKLDSIVERRRKWCNALSESIQDVEGITLPKPTEGCNPSWWFYMIRIVPDVIKTDVDTFAEAIQAEGVWMGAHYIGRPVYEYPIFIDHSAFDHASHPYSDYTYGKGLCPSAEAILDTCVMFSINEGFTESDMEETASAIQRVARWFSSGRKI